MPLLQTLQAVPRHSTWEEGRDAAYTRSYRAIRLVAGGLGIALPFVLAGGDGAFGSAGVGVLDSISAYYHSPMQDVFVGGLCTIGVLLVTYLAGEWRTADFWVSLVAGVAVLGVAFFPTTRPAADRGLPCDQSHGCSLTEQVLGETATGDWHRVFAVVFFVGIAISSALYALAEAPNTPGGRPLRRCPRPQLARFHWAAALLIAVAGLWTVFGADIGVLDKLYVGEVVAVFVFGVSWSVAALAISAPNRVTP